MARVLILTQGPLGETLLEGARTIAGNSERLSALTLGWNDDLEQGASRLRAALAEMEPQSSEEDEDEGVLILTDVPGGTPFNVAMRFAEPGRVAVLSGVNLPMAVRVCCPGCGDKSVDELANWLEQKGRQSIQRGSTLRSGRSAKEDHG